MGAADQLMVSGLKSRLALFAMLAAFLIPISTSSLRGLTHALTCEEQVGAPFTMIVERGRPATILSSMRTTRENEEGLCGGLLVNFRAGKQRGERIGLTVLITNNTSHSWRGTVQLVMEGQRRTSFPLEIGSIPPDTTRSDLIDLSLPDGRTEFDGTLLLGP